MRILSFNTALLLAASLVLITSRLTFPKLQTLEKRLASPEPHRLEIKNPALIPIDIGTKRGEYILGDV